MMGPKKKKTTTLVELTSQRGVAEDDVPVKQSVKIHVANVGEREKKKKFNKSTLSPSATSTSHPSSVATSHQLLHLHFLPSELSAHPSINHISYSPSKSQGVRRPFFPFPLLFFFLGCYKSKTLGDRRAGVYASTPQCSPADYGGRSETPNLICLFSFILREAVFFVFYLCHISWEVGEKQQWRVCVCVCVQRSEFDQMCRVSRCTQKLFHQLLILP